MRPFQSSAATGLMVASLPGTASAKFPLMLSGVFADGARIDRTVLQS